MGLSSMSAIVKMRASPEKRIREITDTATWITWVPLQQSVELQVSIDYTQPQRNHELKNKMITYHVYISTLTCPVDLLLILMAR